MKVKVLMCIVLSVVYSHAQDFSNYKPLRSKGTVPNDFTSSSFAKYQADIENIDKSSNRFERKSKDKFFLSSNYYNDIILRSGRVLFGDPVTIYINKVADYLLEPFDEIRQKVRFYTLKSPVVNAYSMDNGIILISTGLISKLENEVQLAFVICHELIHYIKKHAILQYVEGEKIRKGKGKYNNLSWDDKLFAKLSYSREDELTADREAVDMILSKSDYDLSYVPGTFDILDFHHTPFADIRYDFSDLCPEGHQFDDEYFLKEITPPKPASGYDESKSTHPETRVRKKTIEELISGMESSGTKQKWIISEAEFMNIRNIARFENVHLYIINDQLGEAFYNIYLLQQTFSDNVFLEKAFAYTMYALTLYKNNQQTNDVIPSYLQTGGYFQEITYFFRRMNKTELNCISLNQCWKIFRKYPEDKLIKQINQRLIEELISKHKLNFSDFKKSLPLQGDSLAQPDSTDIIIEDKTSGVFVNSYKTTHSIQKTPNNRDSSETIQPEKEDSLELSEKSTKTGKKNKINISYTLIEIINDTIFEEMYKHISDSLQEIKKNEQQLSVSEKKKMRKHRESNGEALGIDTLLVFEPGFSKIDRTKKDNYRFIESEQTEFTILSYIMRNAEHHNIETSLIDIRLLAEDDSLKYNDCETVKEWTYQFFTHNSDLKMLQWNSEEVNQLTQTLNSEHLLITYFETYKYRRSNYFRGLFVLATTGMIIFAPFYTVYYFIPAHYSTFVAAVINLDSGEVEFVSTSETPIKGNRSWINGIIYNCLYQTKKKPTIN